MVLLETILYIIILMIVHELGHIGTAILLRIPIKKIGVTMKPYPSLYVAVYDNRIQPYKRNLFLISGNIITVICFVAYLLIGYYHPEITYAFIIQIINDLNPFHSDYQVMLFGIICKKDILNAHDNSDDAIKAIYNDKYYLSIYWIVHFFVWGIMSAFLVKNLIINEL